MKEYDGNYDYSSDKDNSMKKPLLVQKYKDTEIEKEREHKKILQELAENLQQESEEENKEILLRQKDYILEPDESSDPEAHRFVINDNLQVAMPRVGLQHRVDLRHRNVEHLAFEPARHRERNIFSRFFSWTQHLYQRAHDGILNIVTSYLDAEHDEPERRF